MFWGKTHWMHWMQRLKGNAGCRFFLIMAFVNRKGACSRCLIYHRLDLTIFHGMLPAFSGQAWTCPFARIWLQCLYCHQSHFWPFFGLFYFPFYFHLFGVLWELCNTTHLFERFSVVLFSSKKMTRFCWILLKTSLSKTGMRCGWT